MHRKPVLADVGVVLAESLAAETTVEESAMNKSDADDEQAILMKKLSRDQQFEKVLTEHHPMISRVIAGYERIPALQQELYQEISVALWRALPKFEQNASLKTYILSIAHKRAISHVAKYVKQKEQSLETTTEYLDPLIHETCPSDNIQQQQQKLALVTAINQLSLGDRQLVTLALEGVSYKDIAEILGLTVTNVGARLNRAKEKLLKLVQTGVPK